MVLSFAGAYLTAEMDDWRLLHVTLGYTMAGLVGFRIVWGLVGTRYARFANFVRGRASILHYFRTLAHGQPEHYVGHNPAGAVTILVFLLLTLLLAGTGWATLYGFGGDAMEEIHEFIANLMLAVVGIHVAGVVVSSWVHRENLIGAMISGRKIGQAGDGIRSAWRGLAVVLLICVLLFWWYQWNQAPAEGAADGRPAAAAEAGVHDGGK